MRINVYAEEMTSEVQIVKKTVNQKLFYGVRLFLKSPKELHYGTSDDDRTGITLWIPNRGGVNHPQIILDALRAMIGYVAAQAIENGDKFIFQETALFKGIEGHEFHDSI